MNRRLLLTIVLALAALACSVGGSSEAPTEPSGGGVPIAKATPTSAEEAPLPTEAPVEPTLAPEPTEAPTEVPEPIKEPTESQGPEVIEATEGEVPIIIVDTNTRMSLDDPVLFGLIQNVSEEALGSVTLAVVFQDADGNVLGSREGYALLTPIGPGELSPFEIYFPDGVPADVDSIGIAARWTPDYGTFPHTREGFELEGIEGVWGEFSHFEISGTLHNRNSKNARFVELAILFYNADDKLIGLYVDRVDDIQAGGSDFFTMSVIDAYLSEPEIEYFEILMVGSLVD